MRNNIQFLMCSPQYYDILYEINPWMNREHKADKVLALTQWNNLKKIISACGAEVKLVEQVPDLPDMVFTANAALIHQHHVFLANFKHPERQGERAHFETWFKENGFVIFDDKQRLDFEGAGDALFAGNKLFCASGFRTNPLVHETIKTWSEAEIISVELVDPYFYHLDTCFCPLNDKQAIWWPDAFTPASQKKLAHEIELLSIPKEDAKKFACNAVVINNYVIIPSGCDDTQKILETLGLIVHQTDMSEYIKAGGACKCLTLNLQNHNVAY